MIEDTFLKLKSNLELNQTFSDAITTRHNAVRSVIENNGLSIKDTKLIGSVGRKTRIQPRPGDEFDIDILVILGEFYNWLSSGGITTSMAMSNVHETVLKTDRYSKMNPEQDHPTVTFSYANDVAIELVPAYLDLVGRSFDGTTHQPTGRAYWVPAPNSKWELADYDYEAEYITTINGNTGGLLIPTVKMLKAAKREHFPALKSYHLEVIATNVIPNIIAEYRASETTPTFPLIVGSFLHHLDRRLGQTWGIPRSLSPTFVIDAAAEAEIRAKADWLKQQLQIALFGKTDGDKHRAWKNIFRDSLPLP
jgi:hypothetical protein